MKDPEVSMSEVYRRYVDSGDESLTCSFEMHKLKLEVNRQAEEVTSVVPKKLKKTKPR
jgi:hypothetical protein